LISLPSSDGGDFDPTWSPDGSRIAFTSLRNAGRPHIFVIYLDDNHVEELSEGFNQDFQPEWSPDGSRILFITTRDGPYQIWIMQMDGSAQQRISTSGDRMNSDPTWSPEGQLIVFTQNDGKGGVSQLKHAPFSEQEFVEDQIYTTVGYLPSQEADFSSDSFWLVFEAWPEPPNHDIYLMTTTGEELTRITNDPANDFDPAWRPSAP
jgi:Tol biopolymer transport system component